MQTHERKHKAENKQVPAKAINSDKQWSKGSHNLNSIEFLHQTIGNQAVQRLFKNGVIQAKLKIGSPNDKYEQEADRVADQIMKNEANIKPKKNISPLKLSRKPNTKSGETNVPSQLESQINTLKGKGQPLDQSTRDFFEPYFGDLNQVRIHTDTNSGEIADSINARAYTYGNDLVFNKESFNPSNYHGKLLLAHELTHVAQQQRSTSMRLKIRRRTLSVKNQEEQATKMDMLQTGELILGIAILVFQVGQLEPFILKQIHTVFGDSEQEAFKSRFTEEQIRDMKVLWGRGGKKKLSLGLKAGEKYSFIEGQMWSRLDFIATMSGSLGTVPKVLEHFGAIKKANVSGKVWLHESAATRLEAACNAFGRNIFPPSYVAMQLRGRHQEKHNRGMLMHPLGYAIDYYPVDNPMLTDDALHTLLEVVGEGPTHMKLTDERGRELSHKTRDAIIVKLGEETASGIEDSKRDPKGLKLLEKVDLAYKRMFATSERFKKALANTPEERKTILNKLKEVRDKYFEEIKSLELKANKTKKEEDRTLLALKRATQRYNKVNDWYRKTWLAYLDINLKENRNKKLLNRAERSMQKARLVSEKAFKKLLLARDNYKCWDRTGKWWENLVAKEQLRAASIPLIESLKNLFAPILEKLDKKITDAIKEKDHPKVDELKSIKERLTSDFSFVFGSVKTLDVKDPPVLQLLERGFARQDPQPSKETKPEDRKQVFNSSFIKIMFMHGFEPGAAWKGSTDTMHFNFAEGKKGVNASSPAKGLDILFRYLVKRSARESGPETLSPEGTNPT